MVSRAAVHDLVDLRDAGAEHGGKAVGLARLIAAGLPVPEGYAISRRVFERFAAGEGIGIELPAELAIALGPFLAVRSSAAIEDGAAGSAAGIFMSEAPVSVDDVWTAIRNVWSSALTPHAIAYASARTHEVALGVIVQRFVPGVRITVYTRPLSGDANDALIQRGEHVERVSRTSSNPIVVLALKAERELGVPADVELVQGDQLWIVQARPIVQRAHVVTTPLPPIVLAPLQDGRTWTWDVTHNPDPLSPAQAGLVELVERAQLGAYELRVCAGYLYSTPRATRASFTNELSGALITACRELEAACERLLSPATSVSRALDQYVAFYRVWADELSPRIAELRNRRAPPTVPFFEHDERSGSQTELDEERSSANSSLQTPPNAAKREHAPRPSSVEATLAAAARGTIDFAEVVRRIGALAPAWDVCAPSFGERPELLHRAIAATEPRAPPREIATETIDLESIVADLAERDDLLFARAQLVVRNALLADADARGIDRGEVFWLPLDDAEIDSIVVKRNAAAARAANDRASHWQMPIVVGGDVPMAATTELRGVGYGPRVVGRVVRFASLASAMFASAGDVVVVRAVTPALAVFVGDCAALVSETGGLLDHGAALARELGITCVVGCTNAWSLLDDGELVVVDGDAGTITAA
jgi:phosphohistidine swiveling domain-containing protein